MLDTQKIVKSEVDKVVKVYEKFKKEEIDPIAKIGNPEKIINKPYEQWTPQDKQMLQQVYVYSPEVLIEFIAKKEVDSVWKMQDLNKKLGV